MTFALLALNPQSLQNVALAILGLGLLVFFHELGHFLAAKRMGMPVEVFSIGFGPRLFGFAWKETDVRLSALPLGGYVKLAGFNPEEPGAEDPHGFLHQPYGKRMLFYSGGILMNLLIAFLCFTAVGMDRARVTKTREWVGAAVEKHSAAEKGGLKTGDEILRIGDIDHPTQANWESTVVPYVRARAGQPILFEIVRNGAKQTLTLTPALEGGIGRLGFGLPTFEEPIEKRPVALRDLGPGMGFAVERMTTLSGAIFGFLKKLVSFQAKTSDVSGPVGMVSMMSDAAGRGLLDLFYFCAFISLQLGILNALPIPMLDGGHMLLLTVEKVRRKDLSLEFKERLLQGGFVLLMSLMAFVFFLDFWKMRK